MTKTILITGSTDGIGRLTAERLAQMGHKVLLHGRSANRLESVAQALGGRGVGAYQADLSSLEETRAMAEAVLADHAQIDAVINNAGVLKAPQPRLANGQDLRFVVNTLAPHVLTTALLPHIPRDGRILNLSSAAQAPVDMAALAGGVALSDMEAYAQSKRAITLWSAEMASQHPEGPVFLAVNPGSLLASKMVHEGFGVAGHDLNIGADILIRLALEDAFAQATGRYWDNDRGGFAEVDMAQARDVFDGIMALAKGQGVSL